MANRNSIARKRRRLSSGQDLPPRKRARLEEPTPQYQHKNTENLTLRYYNDAGSCESTRPKIRLLEGRNKKKSYSVSKDTRLYRDLITQGRVTHILRECQSKLLTKSRIRESNKNAAVTILDSLYGIGDDTLHSPAQAFGGLAHNNIDGPFKSLLDAVQENAHDQRIAETEEEHDVFHDARDREQNPGMVSKEANSRCKTRSSMERKKRNSSTEVSKGTNKDLESRRGSNHSHLPFHFMAGNHYTSPGKGILCARQAGSITPCNNHHSYSARASHLPLGSPDDIIYNKTYSPIRPRPRRGAIMAPYPTPLISLQEAPRSTQSGQDPLAIPLSSPLFDFMSVTAESIQQSTFDSPRDDTVNTMPERKKSSLHVRLASIVQHIFGLAATFLRSWSSTIDNGDIKPNLSSPRSGSTPKSTRSRRTSPNTDPASRPVERGTFQHLPRRREVPTSSHLPTTSNTTFLWADNATITPEQASTTASPSDSFVKNPTHIHPGPPIGWEGLFKPTAGEWKCKTCFYVNPVDAMTCDSCTALKGVRARLNGKAVGEASGRDGEVQSVPLATSSVSTGTSDIQNSDRESEASRTDENDVRVASYPDDEKEAAEDIGGGSKRIIKVSRVTEANIRDSAAKSSREPPPADDHSEAPANMTSTGSGKRAKVESSLSPAPVRTNSPEPMSISPDTTATGTTTKKRNKSEEGEEDELNQVAKLAREEVDASNIMATDADLLPYIDELMDL